MQRESRDTHIRRYYEVVDAGDVEGVLDIFTDDATYCRPGYEPMAGREALRAFYSGDRVIESGRHSVTSLLIDGDEAFVRGEFNGCSRTAATRTSSSPTSSASAPTIASPTARRTSTLRSSDAGARFEGVLTSRRRSIDSSTC